MQKISLSQFCKNIRTCVSDTLTDAVGTWSFVIVYTILITSWIIFHKLNLLGYDSDLTYLNFFLCWLSGIQASVVMMSDSRREEKHHQMTKKDLEVSEKSLEVDLKNKELIRKMTEKVTSMVNKITKLEEIIDLMEKEEEEKIGNIKTRQRGNGSYHGEN